MEPKPIEELQKQALSELDGSLLPGTPEATVLRFLAQKADVGWPPERIASHTGLPEEAIKKTLFQLNEDNLVCSIAGRYFVTPDLQPAIDGLLGDLHHAAQSRHLPQSYEPSSVHEDDIAPVHATDDEIDELLH